MLSPHRLNPLLFEVVYLVSGMLQVLLSFLLGGAFCQTDNLMLFRFQVSGQGCVGLKSVLRLLACPVCRFLGFLQVFLPILHRLQDGAVQKPLQ